MSAYPPVASDSEELAARLKRFLKLADDLSSVEEESRDARRRAEQKTRATAAANVLIKANGKPQKSKTRR